MESKPSPFLLFIALCGLILFPTPSGSVARHPTPGRWNAGVLRAPSSQGRSLSHSPSAGLLACHVVSVTLSAAPHNVSAVDHLWELGKRTSVEECVSRCCSLGPSGCQYVWVLLETCYAVVCNSFAHRDSVCAPRSMVGTPYAKMTSYVEIGFGRGVESALVADAGPTVVVHMPQTDVYLHANTAANPQTGVHYQWSLLSGNLVFVKGINSPVLYVSALKQGDYVFQLAVSSEDRRSDTATVLIAVIDGKAVVNDSRTNTRGLLQSSVWRNDKSTESRATPSTPLSIQPGGDVIIPSSTNGNNVKLSSSDVVSSSQFLSTKSDKTNSNPLLSSSTYIPSPCTTPLSVDVILEGFGDSTAGVEDQGGGNGGGSGVRWRISVPTVIASCLVIVAIVVVVGVAIWVWGRKGPSRPYRFRRLLNGAEQPKIYFRT